MITEEDSIPSKSKNYRLGEDIFYFQFNDVSFFIEDDEQENFFFEILRKLFPEIRIDKIFPLGGKSNVIEESKKNLNDRKKVFIVDLDFDDLLGKIIDQPNLFYLERYSIENYLLEIPAFVSYIIGEKPRLKKSDVIRELELESHLINISRSLRPIVELHLVVQFKCPTIPNVSLGHERFVRVTTESCYLREDQHIWYKETIQSALNILDKRLTVNGQLAKNKKILKFDSYDRVVKHFPGKYIIKLLQNFIERSFSLSSRTNDSFCYHLAVNSAFDSLSSLQGKINAYVKSNGPH